MTYALAAGIWRRRAAYRGTQDGSQHPKRRPGGTNSRRMGAPLKPAGVGIPFPGRSENKTCACARFFVTDLRNPWLECIPRTCEISHKDSTPGVGHGSGAFCHCKRPLHVVEDDARGYPTAQKILDDFLGCYSQSELIQMLTYVSLSGGVALGVGSVEFLHASAQVSDQDCARGVIQHVTRKDDQLPGLYTRRQRLQIMRRWRYHRRWKSGPLGSHSKMRIVKFNHAR